MFFCISISYFGKQYRGIAKQEGFLTIQGVIESKLYKFFNDMNIKTSIMSRTDKYVNAYQQYLFFESNTYDDQALSLITKKINFELIKQNHEIYVHRIKEIHKDKVRRSFSKTYIYKFCLYKNGCLMNSHEYLDLGNNSIDDFIKAIESISNIEYDYSIFCKQLHKNNRPTVQKLIIKTKNHIYDGLPVLYIEVMGRCFLFRQIRLICGTIANMVSKIKINSDVFFNIDLIKKYKCASSGHALFLKNIEVDF